MPLKERLEDIERRVVLNKTDMVDIDVGKSILGIENDMLAKSEEIEGTNNLFPALEALEKKMIVNAVKNNKSKRKTGEVIGIDHSTLLKKCKKYEL